MASDIDEGLSPPASLSLIVTPAQAGAQSREHGFHDSAYVFKAHVRR
jgi:hypothetical protein